MGSSSTEVSTIVKNWREHPPASYSLKIHSFSQFENSSSSSDDKYQSRLFSSGRYKCKSLMVFTPPTEVFAEIRFFIYNKKENKYFTIQDVEVKRFNALKTVWGLQQILPCDTFSNPENGYIFEGGQCEFGVDVIVSLPLTNWEVLSYTEKFSNSKFSWAIKNFSELKENVLTSKSFSMAGKKWFLKLYPKGDSRADGKFLSIFLCLDDCDKPKDDEKISVQANFRVLDKRGSNHFQCQFNFWYNEQQLGGGWFEFLSLPELPKVYLDKEDALKVEIEFKAVSATKYSPII
uniref:MATH domain-containing protein n=1 Tax=Brassica campestris TaxID=3711 RepID=M4CIF5_BRACM